MYEVVDHYKARGYKELCTDSGTGSIILENSIATIVVKINQDPAYDQFAELVQTHNSSCFPQISSHTKPNGDFVQGDNSAYSVTEMEHLSSLSPDEQEALRAWIKQVVEQFKGGQDLGVSAGDPFGLIDGLRILHDHAQTEYKNGNKIGLDICKVSNFMARITSHGREIVITDPFN